MTLVIREAGTDDRERLVDLLQQLNVYEDRLTGDRRTDRAGAADNLAETTARVDGCGGKMLVAEAEGRVAGFLALTFAEDKVYIRPEQRPYACIAELVVDEDFRRRGIAAALMREAEGIAAGRGYHRLVIGFIEGNRAAEAAYARQGFRPQVHILEKPIGEP